MEVDSDAPIESMLNLGPNSGRSLREAGITTIAELEFHRAPIYWTTSQGAMNGMGSRWVEVFLSPGFPIEAEQRNLQLIHELGSLNSVSG